MPLLQNSALITQCTRKEWRTTVRFLVQGWAVKSAIQGLTAQRRYFIAKGYQS